MKTTKKCRTANVPPTRETIAKRLRRGWTEREANDTPTLLVGNRIKTETRPYCYQKKNGDWSSNVRLIGDQREYVGTFDTREDAVVAADYFIRTGTKTTRPRKRSSAYKPRATRTATPSRKTPQALQRPIPREAMRPDRTEMMRMILRRIDG